MADKGWKGVVAASVGVVLAISLLIAAFAWPAANIRPRDVPIGVAGPTAAVEQVRERLETSQPGAFEITGYADEQAVREAIENRDIYGAIVAGGPPTVLSAPAGSPLVAQVLDGVAAAISGTKPAISTQVVALPAEDPRGAGFSAGALPMVLGALVTGIAVALLIGSIGLRLVALGTASIGAGLAAAALLGPWLGILPGGYVETAAVIALGFAAGGAVLIGFESVFGQPGIGVGALLLMVVGNPISGATSAPEMLPTGWGALGQWLPPGALTTLLRSISYFDGAGGARPTAILLGWTVIGITLAAIGARRRAAARPTETPPPALVESHPSR